MKTKEFDKIIGSLDNYQCVSDNRALFEAYYNAFQKYDLEQGDDDDVTKMLKRRLFLPILPHQTNGILIIGANPSYDGTDENFMKTIDELYGSGERHWKEIKTLASVIPEHPAAYLDLFPLKQTALGGFEKAFRKHEEIRAKLLQVTHERMLSIQPRIIINLYAMTAYYWGFKPDAPDYCNEKNPWMGYKFKKIETCGLDIYEITGWVDNENVILSNDENKRLRKGTIIIFSSKSWNKQVRELKMVNKSKLKQLLLDLDIKL